MLLAVSPRDWVGERGTEPASAPPSQIPDRRSAADDASTVGSMSSEQDRFLADHKRRTRQLEALYETAGDLTALRDVDEVLAAIVRRSRQLLGSDVAYLMLTDDDRRQIHVRVGEGIQTQEFLAIRLRLGEGIAGLVASTGLPFWTPDYARDERLVTRIDAVVQRESLVAILGVPLSTGGRVLGVLLASDRRQRDFTHDEVALLTSLAHHAAIALENASLFQEARKAVAGWRDVSAQLEQQNLVLERAAALHEQLTRLVLGGASISALANAVAATVGGVVVVLDAKGVPLTPAGAEIPLPGVDGLEAASAAAGRVHTLTQSELQAHVVAVQAGARRLGYLLHWGNLPGPDDLRALERASMVTALLLLDRHAHDEAHVRAVGRVLLEFISREQSDLKGVRRRARAAGVIVPSGPYVVAVALSPGGDECGFDFGAAAVRAVQEGWLAHVDGRELTLIVPSTDAAATAQDLADLLTEAVGERINVGAAGPTRQESDLARLVVRARNCAQFLQMAGQRGRGATAEGLGVYALLLSDLGRERIDDYVTEMVGAVQQWDQAESGRLMTTLEKYFEEGGQTGRLADALYIHVNTLYQRLDRLDRLLGPGWRRGEQALQVHLAVRLARLLSPRM